MSVGKRITRILVIGAGTMGTQIGAVFALGGFDVVVTDVTAVALKRAGHEAGARIRRLAETDRLSVEDAEAAIARMSWTTDVPLAAAEADLIVEAATERLDLKRAIFAQLAEVAPARAIFSTNSSTIPSSAVAEASGRPDRLCNLHFFNPALVMRCVEIVPNPRTSEETISAVLAVVARLGKEPVRLSAETPGFIANRLMLAVQDEAISLYENGIAGIEDIDTAARLALGHPMGPFALMDLVGLDVIELIHRAQYDISGDTSDLPASSIVDRVAAGDLGRKSGRGWFSYDRRPA
ncbi:MULTISPECIES: 3-hydroxyacyl-CoA dehydrogenase family protein [unclassified Microbacterium]|uniref:3-hydroxyacyl-CoA dehydrogenase family protein n=1 Tax=unclassified Microbacterium TaxID=2609290 RepID=UPI00214AF58D|nr:MULTISPECIES: 3-hydroxyacyl-CoA dehydrogenase family protein [unclassified Microbacterium]MCR2811321.1 3-hydroxyacyl-CoA dehydrogenase family protein [Microbacterium sp. zg.B185]WIM19478.1 3-hydroxyacyl-CoA dehydrogenase family protein [Microbacterium sp. zg-B185]